MRKVVIQVIAALTGETVELNKSSYTSKENKVEELLVDLGFVKVPGIASRTTRAIVVSDFNGFACFNYSEVTIEKGTVKVKDRDLVDPEFYVFTGEISKGNVAHEVYTVLKRFVKLKG